jgi:hypothetical protein
MNLGVDEEKKVAVIEFSWREIWSIIKSKRLSFNLESIELFANMVVRLHMEFDGFSKKNQQKETKQNSQLQNNKN